MQRIWPRAANAFQNNLPTHWILLMIHDLLEKWIRAQREMAGLRSVVS